MWISYSILFWTVVHVIAHYVNYHNIFLQLGVPELYLALWTGPGLSGQIISVVFFLMITSALEAVRRKHFEIFWFTHHLFLVFFGGLLVHGSFCFIKTNTPDPCNGGPSFWKFWIASAIVYLLERILREVRGRKPTFISKVVQHPSKVVELQIVKEGWLMQAGQYVFVCCPEISVYEWHPYTLTSSNYDEFLSIHVRVVGDWTSEFAKRVGCRFDDQDKHLPPPKSLPFVMVDGPYGAASEDVFDYDVSVLIGMGIGVTPFASILKTIWYRINSPSAPVDLKKVHFIWVCRDKESFEWFQDLLSILEEEYIDNFLEIHSYLTEKFDSSDVKNILLNDGENGKDVITGLRSKTTYGRPNWDHIFENLRNTHPATDIGVFYCGPKPLSNDLFQMCSKWTESTERGTRFFYAKENF